MQEEINEVKQNAYVIVQTDKTLVTSLVSCKYVIWC